MWFFSAPRKIVFGEDALDALQEIQAKHALIITDKHLTESNLHQPLITLLTEQNITYTIYDAVTKEPDIPTAQQGAQLAEQNQADLLIALGGGSVIDCAKAIWILYENPDMNIAEVFPEDPLPLRKKATLITIPTTSGTGSDANWAIVIKDPETGQKLSVAHRDLIPDLDIVDPQFTKTLPPRLTGATAFDALTHAIEAYTVDWKNDFSDGLAKHAIQLILTYLPQLHTNPQDQHAREHLHNAATLAGIAFGNSQIGGAHALAHALGAVYNLPHSELVGLILPHMMNYCKQNPETAQRYADLAYHNHLSNTNKPESADALITHLQSLLTTLNLPTKLSDYNITKENLIEHIDELQAFILSDTGALANPQELDEDNIARLLNQLL